MNGMNEKMAGSVSRTALSRLFLLLLPILVSLICLCIGRIALTPAEVGGALLDGITGGERVPGLTRITVCNLRLPRILLALLTGAGLSAAGCAFQSLFANPLATPDTLGVAGGSGFGAALGLLLGFGLIGVQITSFLFGIAAVLLTWLAGSGRGRGLGTVVLSGIMIGSLFSSLISLVKFTADTESELPAITFFLMGSLNAASYRTLLIGAPAILIGIGILLLLRWRMNLLPLPEDEVRAAGVGIGKLRLVTAAAATLITASCVSMCGQVGWVGLLIPHICRMKYGSNHTVLLPASVSLGAAFMVAVDTAARSLTAAELPVSILTALVGAPFFILLMRRSRGWRL